MEIVDIPSTQAAIAADPLGVPHGVSSWLNGIEVGARQTLEKARSRLGQPHCIDSVKEAAARLAEFAGGRGPATIRGILARPKATLAPGTPTHLLFEQLATSRIDAVTASLELQRRLDAIAQQ